MSKKQDRPREEYSSQKKGITQQRDGEESPSVLISPAANFKTEIENDGPVLTHDKRKMRADFGLSLHSL